MTQSRWAKLCTIGACNRRGGRLKIRALSCIQSSQHLFILSRLVENQLIWGISSEWERWKYINIHRLSFVHYDFVHFSNELVRFFFLNILKRLESGGGFKAPAIMRKNQRIEIVPPVNIVAPFQISLFAFFPPISSTTVDLPGPPLSVWAKGCTQD